MHATFTLYVENNTDLPPPIFFFYPELMVGRRLNEQFALVTFRIEFLAGYACRDSFFGKLFDIDSLSDEPVCVKVEYQFIQP